MHSDAAGAEAASELMGGLTAAWNAHDMTAFGRLFHDDATFVNVAGVLMMGRSEIERIHAIAHTGPLRDTRLSATLVKLHQLRPGLAVVHLDTEMVGDQRLRSQLRRAVLTLVVDERDGEWKIAAAHNTNVVALAG